MKTTLADSVEAVRHRQLGSSDLQASEIALGSWLTYGGGVDPSQAEACVAKAFEVGINFIDTANVYAGGKEEFLGEVLADSPRDSYVLATKVFFQMPNGDRGLSRAQIAKQIDASLARLRTDYVDLYQCQRYDWDSRSRRRWMRSPTWSARGRRATSASASGRPMRSRRRSSCPASSSSRRASRSTR
jgi:aryl-alcohol dehydrogenase-like predicted oxidoreductase